MEKIWLTLKAVQKVGMVWMASQSHFSHNLMLDGICNIKKKIKIFENELLTSSTTEWRYSWRKPTIHRVFVCKVSHTKKPFQGGYTIII